MHNEPHNPKTDTQLSHNNAFSDLQYPLQIEGGMIRFCNTLFVPTDLTAISDFVKKHKDQLNLPLMNNGITPVFELSRMANSKEDGEDQEKYKARQQFSLNMLQTMVQPEYNVNINAYLTEESEKYGYVGDTAACWAAYNANEEVLEILSRNEQLQLFPNNQLLEDYALSVALEQSNEENVWLLLSKGKPIDNDNIINILKRSEPKTSRSNELNCLILCYADEKKLADITKDVLNKTHEKAQYLPMFLCNTICKKISDSLRNKATKKIKRAFPSVVTTGDGKRKKHAPTTITIQAIQMLSEAIRVESITNESCYIQFQLLRQVTYLQLNQTDPLKLSKTCEEFSQLLAKIQTKCIPEELTEVVGTITSALSRIKAELKPPAPTPADAESLAPAPTPAEAGSLAPASTLACVEPQQLKQSSSQKQQVVAAQQLLSLSQSGSGSDDGDTDVSGYGGPSSAVCKN